MLNQGLWGSVHAFGRVHIRRDWANVGSPQVSVTIGAKEGEMQAKKEKVSKEETLRKVYELL